MMMSLVRCARAWATGSRGVSMSAGHHAVHRDVRRRDRAPAPRVKPTRPALAVIDMRAVLRAGMRAQAADIDDRARAALLQARQAGLDAMERAVEGDAEHLAPFLEAHLLERLLRAQRGVVDQDSRCGRML